MKIFPSTRLTPARRDLVDARSSAAPAPKVQKTLLNDPRSTR
ncbi:hypothetical protein [Phenylobacterium sp. J367]|nr:hypothetical protein [Phenylobacterium sp. J367]